MRARTEARAIPTSPRYFSADLGAQLGTWHFRFPSYGKATKLVGLLQGFREGDGLERLVELLDVAGYAIGQCWYHRAYDLEAGLAPSADGDWRAYGDQVVDELQEHGLGLRDLMTLVNEIIEELAARMSEMAEAQEQAPNS